MVTPFGRLAPRVQQSGRPDLEPLSVFLGAGVVPRSTREDNHNQLGEDMAKYLVVEPGDIVFNKLRTWQGGLGASSHHGIVSPAYFVCRPQAGVSPRFLHYLLLSEPYLQELTRVSKWQPPSQFDISWEQLRQVAIAAPALATQEAIADYLDVETARIDALIEKKQRMKEVLERRSAATLDDRLSGLFRPDVPLVPLRYVLRERDQRAVGSETVLSVYREYGVILKASREDNFNKTPDDLSNYKIVRRGDVVVNKMKAWQGSLGVSSHDGIVSGDYLVCETTQADVTHEYLHHLLRSPLLIGEYGVRSTGIRPSQWRLYWNDFASIQIPIPSISEQAELAEELKSEYHLTQRLLEVVEASIDLLRERRQALITAAVTGELEIKGAAA